MEEISITEYFQTLNRWRWVVLGAGLAFAAAAFILMLFSPKVYRATAVIIFPNPEPNISSISASLNNLSIIPPGSVTSQTGVYAEILKSATLNRQVIADLRLDTAGITPSDLQRAVNISFTKDGGLVMEAHASSKWIKKGSVTIPASKREDETLRGKTRALAEGIADAFLYRLQDFSREHALLTGEHERSFLEKEVSRTRIELSEAEEALQRFREAHPALPLPDASLIKENEQIAALKMERMGSETEYREIEESARKAKLEIDDQASVQTASTVITQNPVVIELKKNLADAEVQRARLLKDMTENHPDVVSATELINSINQKIGEEVERETFSETLQLNPVRQTVLQEWIGLKIKQGGLEARRDALTEVAAALEREISKNAKDQVQYLRLLRDQKTLESVYTSLLTGYSQAKVAEAKEPDSFTILDWGVADEKPAKPQLTKTTLAAFIVGLIIGAFMAIIKDSSRIRKYGSVNGNGS